MDWQYTNFEGMTHEQLLGLLAPGQGEKVAGVGRSLAKAAEKIQEAAERLKLKSDHVAWEGSSAQQFQSWTSDLVTSSFQLADFTRGIGQSVEIAGNKLTETKNSLPKISPEDVAVLKALEDNPTAGGMFDPVTGVTAHDQAKAAVDGPRLEAAAQLRTLASTYIASAQEIGRLPKPQFRPPPDPLNVGRPGVTDYEDVGAAAGVASAAAVAAASQTSLAGGPSGTGTATPYTSPANASTGWPPPTAPGTPSVVTAGQVTPGTLPSGSNLLGQAPTQMTQATNVSHLGGSGPNATSSAPPVIGRAPIPATGGIPDGAKGVGTVRGGMPGVSGGTNTGQVRPGATPTGRAPGLRTGGVEGGTARPGQMTGAGEARTGPTTRPGVPVGGAAGIGASGTPTASGRTAAGRPPIGTPGGIVGGNAAHAVPPSRGQFSSGGSGLRSGLGRQAASESGTQGGAQPRSGRPVGGLPVAPMPSEEAARRRRRADYLEEDDETWGNGQSSGAVPPVIG